MSVQNDPSARDLRVLQAAWERFARYGVAKTTMSDVARAAGVTRQTVYNAYPGKPELMRAVVRLAVDQSVRDVTAAWQGARGVDAKIRAFLDHCPLAWFRTLADAPDLAELLEGIHSVAAEEIAEAEAAWIALLEEMFVAEAALTGTADITARDLAEFLYTAGVNAKYGVTSAAQFEARLAMVEKATRALLHVPN